ncbi:MAG: PEP-CTERM sorting domain-containing protein [Desulfobacula sp.]|jgi:hypothetical protein|nr:PEP-CTERM sorting domain-containing protein [Desulfobacula sp.]
MQFVSCVKKVAITTGIVLFCSLISQSSIMAATIGTSDITTAGSFIEFATGDLFFLGPVTLNGGYSKKEGGADTGSTYNATGITSGLNPIYADFTALGDGFGLSGAVDTQYDSEFLVGIDFGLILVNQSLTDDYKVTIQVDYSNWVDAGGGDAWADSEFTIDDSSGERFFTDVISDTVNGDEFNGNLLASFGDKVSDIGPQVFDVLLNADTFETLSGAWTMEGGTPSADANSIALADFSATVSIMGVENLSSPNPIIPEPGTIFLLGFGLLGMAGLSRTRKNRV